MNENEQYVITFNDFPEEVCAPGTTQEQAEARAKQIKADYLASNPTVHAHMLHITPRSTRIWKP